MVIGDRRGRWTYRNYGDIGLSPASHETTQTNKSPKHYTKTVLLKKEETCPMGRCHHKGPTQPERNGGKTRRRMTSERQINSLPGLLAVKMIQQQIGLTNRLTHQSTTLTNVPRQLLLLLLLLLKEIGNARPGEGDLHPISPKTPAPHYQPIEEKKRRGK